MIKMTKTWTALSAIALASIFLISSDAARAEVCNDEPVSKSTPLRLGSHAGRATSTAAHTPAVRRTVAAQPTARPARVFAAKVQSRVQRATFTPTRSSTPAASSAGFMPFDGAKFGGGGGDGGGGGGGGSM